MTYYHHYHHHHRHSQVETYTFCALSKTDTNGTIKYGSSFTMPATTDTELSIKDGDRTLSGDRNDRATDSTNQYGTITVDGQKTGNTNQVYVEQYWKMQGSDGKTYRLYEIEQEHSNTEVYAFDKAYGIPPAGVTLKAIQCCNTSGIKYDRLDAKAPEPETGAVKGTVFMDNNDNARDDAGDMDIEGVTVRLLNENGEEVATTTTNAQGDYHFNDVPVGKYKVDFPTSLPGKVLVQKDAPGSNIRNDSDADLTTGETNTFHVNANRTTSELDAGYKVPAPTVGSLSGRYFEDLNDNDQDDGEPGVGGVNVMLLDAAGNPTGQTTTTAADGSYSFDDLAPGTYGVKFTDDVSGQVLVAPNVGPDATDSDAIDQGNGMSTISGISVTAGNDTPDNDAGVEDRPVELGSVEGRIWMDANDNSLEDAGEMGVAGVRVTLRDLDNGTNVRTTTDADGNYSFEDLPAGRYLVRFPAIDGKTYVDGNVGNDDTIDSDPFRVNDNGVAPTRPFDLGEGEHRSDVDAGVEDVVTNEAPTPRDDAGTICASEDLTVNVLANDTDADGDTLTITQVDGQDIADGDTVVTGDGVEVTLSGGQLVFNGGAAYGDLSIGDTVVDSISYTVSDGTDAATANADITFCGEANDIAELSESLPARGTYKIAADNEDFPIGDAAYDLFLDGTGDARFDGKIFEQAYCLTFFDPVDAAETFADAPDLLGDLTHGNDGSVLDGSTSFATGTPAADNMDLINYILNQEYESDAQYTGWEVQLAIWELSDNIDSSRVIALDPAYGDQADVDTIVADAIANGEGFEAGAGDIASFIVDPNPTTDENSQPFIVAIEFNEYDCLC